MTIKNPKLFGLDANRALADVKNKTLALKNLGISPLDLEVIYGARNAQNPVTFDDWRSFSRLESPLWKTLDRYNSDSNVYSNATVDRAGTNTMLFGNLVINGKLSGNAIRYRYIAGSGAGAETKIADISTSRVSAWSSSVPEPIPATAAISYGSRIGIRSGGRLKFGTSTTGAAGEHQLKTSLVPQATEFAAELPTSKIQAKINGKTIEFYAMKGIPLSFRGLFRSFSGSVGVNYITVGDNQIQPSWKVSRVDGGGSSSFPDTTSISFSSVRTRERTINLYYPSDKFNSISLSSANIFEIPTAIFSGLTQLYLQWNELRNFPDLTTIAPNLTTLDISHNYFHQSETSTERRFNAAIAAKIPASVTNLNMGGTFYGSITQNIIADRFTNLQNFNLGRGGRAYFHPDSSDQSSGSCTIPNVSNTVTTFNIQSNDFRRFDNTANGTSRFNLKQLTNLTTIQLYGNYYLSDNISLAGGLSCGNTLLDIGFTSTGLVCPDFTNFSELQKVDASWTRSFGTFFTSESGGVYTGYKFSGCNKLSRLNVLYSGVTGPFPIFENSQLSHIDFYSTGLSGGDPSVSGGGNYVISASTFASCPNLDFFRVHSSSLLQKEIHPDAFAGNASLTYLYISSNRRVLGAIPTLSTCPQLRHLDLTNNAFTGSPPSFSSNPNINYVYLNNNQLDSSVPSIKNLSALYYLYLQGNKLTGVNTFENLPYLYRLYLHHNQIAGEIPDFTECPRLQYLMLYDNKWTSYKEGSFKELYYLRWLDISTTNLSQSAYHQIIDDLYENWETVPRGSVTINTKRIKPEGAGDYLIPAEAWEEKIIELNSNGWNWVYKN